MNKRKDKPPIPAGYEPTAFASEGTKVTLSIGDKRIGDVACFAHDGEVYPHMALRGMEETK